MTYEYAVTLRKTRNPISFQHYADYLNWLNQFGDVVNVYVERTKGLHLHFMFISPIEMRNQHWKYAKHGWSIKAVPIYNRHGWVKYSAKDILTIGARTDKLLLEALIYPRKYEDHDLEDKIAQEDCEPKKNLFD